MDWIVDRQSAFSEDTGIGVLFVGMLALGVMLASGQGANPLAQKRNRTPARAT